ncbi:MAG: hypothetical protein RBS56_04100 [Candidatus Gracilibacteria bacterium]|jgi:hypothetical protein|nr:hypothetical protein [Candidatus Gracilibacteria bacterium]
MKNVENNARKGLIVNKSFVGLLIALVVVSAVAYGVLKDQFAGNESSPPSLSFDTELLQGLIKTGIYLRFDEDDFQRTINLPTPTMRNRGLGYFYAERDMTMLEIANSIAPDEDLRVIIAHFGENLDRKSGEDARMFYTFPYGRYGNSKEINEDNESDYIVKAYEGIIIAGSKNFGTWNLKQASQLPLRTFNRMNSLDQGWNLIVSDDLANTYDSCRNRVGSVWELRNNSSGDFKKLEIEAPEFSEDKYLAWFFMTGERGTCVDFRAESAFRCVEKQLRDSSSHICINNNWVPCDSDSDGFSAFSSEFVCNGTAWVRTSETSISVNTVVPSLGAPYEAENSVVVFFNEENVIPSDALESVTLKKAEDTKGTDKAIEVSFDENAGFVSVKYSLLEPLTQYEIEFPAGSLKRNDVENVDDLFAEFVTSGNATPPYVGKTSCTDPNGGIDILNGNTVQKECATCTCRFGSLACPRIMCPENLNTCSVNGEINKDGALCVNEKYLECSKAVAEMYEKVGSWTLSGGVYSNMTGARYVCENDNWIIRTRFSNDKSNLSDETPEKKDLVFNVFQDPSNLQKVVITLAPLETGKNYDFDSAKLSQISFGHLENGAFVSDLATTDCEGNAITNIQFLPQTSGTTVPINWLLLYANTKHGNEYRITLPEGLFKTEGVIFNELSTTYVADYLGFLEEYPSCKLEVSGTDYYNFTCLKSVANYSLLNDKQKELVDILYKEYKSPITNAVVTRSVLDSISCRGDLTSPICNVCPVSLLENESNNLNDDFSFRPLSTEYTPLNTSQLAVIQNFDFQNLYKGACSAAGISPLNPSAYCDGNTWITCSSDQNVNGQLFNQDSIYCDGVTWSICNSENLFSLIAEDSLYCDGLRYQECRLEGLFNDDKSFCNKNGKWEVCSEDSLSTINSAQNFLCALNPTTKEIFWVTCEDCNVEKQLLDAVLEKLP